MNRRDVLKFATAGSVAVALTPKAMLAKNLVQVEAIQRFQIGDVTVTAISDGFTQIPHDIFPAVDATLWNKMQAEAFLTPETYKTAINAFLLDDGKKVHLIDTGAKGFAPTVGHLQQRLAAAGYSPEQVDTIVVTHLHPDHIGGAQIDGAAAFPSAEMVVHQADYDFWTNADIRAGAPEAARPFFDTAVAAVSSYQDRLRLFTGEADILPGLTALPLPGHTPGHTGYALSSGQDTLLFWADIVHVPFLQFPDPNLTISFDVDQDQARATRNRVMDQVSTDRLMVAGAHLTFPGVGFVEKTGSGYAFHAAPWQYSNH